MWVWAGGCGADSSDVGHVIQMGMRGGSQNGGITGPMVILLRDDCFPDCSLLLSFLEVRFDLFMSLASSLLNREHTSETHMHHMQQKMLLLSESARAQKGEALQHLLDLVCMIHFTVMSPFWLHSRIQRTLSVTRPSLSRSHLCFLSFYSHSVWFFSVNVSILYDQAVANIFW